mmetsp:Transcript_43035/g.126516  ORF Transcript_43035/g.126516 Transcript_43035/m.126516 type:complete len:326 (-) Transcript_43035:6-983(-)
MQRGVRVLACGNIPIPCSIVFGVLVEPRLGEGLRRCFLELARAIERVVGIRVVHHVRTRLQQPHDHGIVPRHGSAVQRRASLVVAHVGVRTVGEQQLPHCIRSLIGHHQARHAAVAVLHVNVEAHPQNVGQHVHVVACLVTRQAGHGGDGVRIEATLARFEEDPHVAGILFVAGVGLVVLVVALLVALLVALIVLTAVAAIIGHGDACHDAPLVQSPTLVGSGGEDAPRQLGRDLQHAEVSIRVLEMVRDVLCRFGQHLEEPIAAVLRRVRNAPEWASWLGVAPIPRRRWMQEGLRCDRDDALAHALDPFGVLQHRPIVGAPRPV